MKPARRLYREMTSSSGYGSYQLQYCYKHLMSILLWPVTMKLCRKAQLQWRDFLAHFQVPLYLRWQEHAKKQIQSSCILYTNQIVNLASGNNSPRQLHVFLRDFYWIIILHLNWHVLYSCTEPTSHHKHHYRLYSAWHCLSIAHFCFTTGHY